MRNHLHPLLILAACCSLVPAVSAQPRGKGRTPKAATQADIDRLEKKVDAQQAVIDKMVKLQQQYAQALVGLTDGSPAPVVTDKPAPVPEPPADKPAAKPVPAVVVKPAVVKPKPVGVGTVVGKVTGVAEAVVYVEDIVASTKGTASMKQEGKQFSPSVLIVQKGTKVDFPNRDAIFHNVFSMSPDNTFDLGSYPQGDSKSVTMTKAGVVTVYCNMHPQMVGHILVVPNGNYVRAGKDGFFRLPNIPAGPHRIVAWAPNSKPVVVESTVSDGEVVTLELQLKKGRAGVHSKKDGLPYGSYEQ